MRIFAEPEVLSQQIEKRPGLFTFYTSCANFSSVALIVASESWCVKNNNNNNNNKNKNNSKEGTTESVKGQRAVAPLTLINAITILSRVHHCKISFAWSAVLVTKKLWKGPNINILISPNMHWKRFKRYLPYQRQFFDIQQGGSAGKKFFRPDLIWMKRLFIYLIFILYLKKVTLLVKE